MKLEKAYVYFRHPDTFDSVIKIWETVELEIFDKFFVDTLERFPVPPMVWLELPLIAEFSRGNIEQCVRANNKAITTATLEKWISKYIEREGVCRKGYNDNPSSII